MKITLILTATIDPDGMIYLKRSDPTVRLRDYSQALEAWMMCGNISEIVFCENSMYKLDLLYELVQKFHQKPIVRFLQFDGNNYPRNLGKGYGEAKIINHVLDNVEKEQSGSHSYFVKCTGRIYVSNFHKIIDRSMWQADFISMPPKLLLNNMFVDSRIFAGSWQTFKEIFSGFADEVDDSKYLFFEHILARRLQERVKEGLNWIPFNVLPRYVGVSGTSGRSYNRIIKYYSRSIKYHFMLDKYKKLMSGYKK